MIFPYQEQSNVLCNTSGGGVLVEGGEHKRSRVKLYDPNLLKGKGVMCNVPKVVDSHPTGVLSYNTPTVGRSVSR